jgi:hypothetical protein
MAESTGRGKDRKAVSENPRLVEWLSRSRFDPPQKTNRHGDGFASVFMRPGHSEATQPPHGRGPPVPAETSVNVRDSGYPHSPFPKASYDQPCSEMTLGDHTAYITRSWRRSGLHRWPSSPVRDFRDRANKPCRGIEG